MEEISVLVRVFVNSPVVFPCPNEKIDIWSKRRKYTEENEKKKIFRLKNKVKEECNSGSKKNIDEYRFFY